MQDEQAIQQRIARFANSFDLKDWEALGACLTEQIYTDYSELRGTPPEIVSRLNNEMRRYLSTAEARDAYDRLGHEASPSTPEQLLALMRADAERYGRVIRDAKITID